MFDNRKIIIKFAVDLRNLWRDMAAREYCVSANILNFNSKWI